MSKGILVVGSLNMDMSVNLEKFRQSVKRSLEMTCLTELEAKERTRRVLPACWEEK